MADSCPDLHELRELLEESLPAAEQQALQGHLEQCANCQRTLESLAGGPDSWSKAARRLAEAAAEAPAEPALRKVMAEWGGAASSRGDATEPTSVRSDDLSFLGASTKPDSLGRLAHYEILEVLGRGGFGVVFKARDEKLDRIVAIKALAAGLASKAGARKRFTREAKAAAAISHDHVVGIHAVEEANGTPYIVMQMVAGLSLQQRVDQSGPLELKEVLRIGMQTAAGLAASHAQGLVHRDIKPANILLENGIERVKITDFGLARTRDDADMSQSGVIAGTPMYMAPEQAAGETVDHRADLFSLGSVLYTLCTGRPPFRASGAMGVLKRVIDETPRPIREINPDIPDWLCAIIAKLHAKKPGDRFHSAAELAELLSRHLAYVQQAGLESVQTGATVRARPRPARRILSAAAVAGLLFAAISGLGFVSYGHSESGVGLEPPRSTSYTGPAFSPEFALVGFSVGALIGAGIAALWNSGRLARAVGWALTIGVCGFAGMWLAALFGTETRTTFRPNGMSSESHVPTFAIVAGAVLGLTLGVLGAWFAARLRRRERHEWEPFQRGQM